MQHMREAGGVKSEKGEAKTKEFSNADLLGLERHVLVPAALERQTTTDNCAKINARIILEMANGPVSPEAHRKLNEACRIIMPDIKRRRRELPYHQLGGRDFHTLRISWRMGPMRRSRLSASCEDDPLTDIFTIDEAHKTSRPVQHRNDGGLSCRQSVQHRVHPGLQQHCRNVFDHNR